MIIYEASHWHPNRTIKHFINKRSQYGSVRIFFGVGYMGFVFFGWLVGLGGFFVTDKDSFDILVILNKAATCLK